MWIPEWLAIPLKVVIVMALAGLVLLIFVILCAGSGFGKKP
jgi:hypothetical protein